MDAKYNYLPSEENGSDENPLSDDDDDEVNAILIKAKAAKN